jgi:hypothetical protein
MKQLVKNYSFNTSTKAVTMSDFTTIALQQILLVVDITTGKIIYNPMDGTGGPPSVATNVLTLTALQGGENNTDKLGIFYEAQSGDPAAVIYDGGQRTMAASHPVVLASDQSSIPVAATLNVETTKSIGVVRTADGSGNLLTSTGTALDVNVKSGAIPTGSNTIGAVTQSGNWTTRMVGNAGATLDSAAAGATAPTNAVLTGAVFNTSALSLSSGQAGALQMDAAGNLKVVANTQALGATAPTLANYIAISDHTGILRGVQSVLDYVGQTGANLMGTGPLGQFKGAAYAPADGQFEPLQLDQAANLRIFPGMAGGLALSAWTSATALNATQNIFTNSGAAAVLVALNQTNTITGGAITFEVTYDSVNWVAIPADAVVDPTSVTYAQIALPYTLQASTNKTFLIISEGWTGLRIKLSTAITGTATVTPSYSLLPVAPVLPTLSYITNGTQNADTLSSDSGQNALVTTGNRKEVSFTTTTAQAVASTDASNYRFVSVQITSQGGSSTVTFQTSNDNSTWVTCKLSNPNSTNTGVLGATSSTGMYAGPVPGRYFRLNVSGIASGTTAGVVEFFSQPNTSWIQSIAIQDINGNPAVPQAGSVGDNITYGMASQMYAYSGANVERWRNNLNTTTGDTGAKTGNFQGATQTNYNAAGAVITLKIGTVSGTVTTFQTGIEFSYDGGTTWLALTALGANITSPASGNTIVWYLYPGNGAVTPAAVAGGSAATQWNQAAIALPRTWRFSATIAGSSPSITFTSVNVNYIL